MVVFAAATGLRRSELFALERRDIDRALGVVYVRRAYANGRLKNTAVFGLSYLQPVATGCCLFR
jgi:integrase